MRRMPELVDRRYTLDPVAAVDQDFRVARKCRHIARYRDHHGNLADRKLLRLRLRAMARRIEHDRVVVAQLLRHQRPPEQVARLGLYWLQSGTRGRRLLQGCDRAGIAVE